MVTYPYFSTHMLEMKSQCERCSKLLKVHEHEAYICSFECTFCQACTANDLQGVCPNCGGELVRRPSREKSS